MEIRLNEIVEQKGFDRNKILFSESTKFLFLCFYCAMNFIFDSADAHDD